MTPACPPAARRLVQNTPLLTFNRHRHPTRPVSFKMTEPASVMAGRAKQRMQENEEDKITRKAGDFKAFEADMPKLANRFSLSLIHI